MSNLPDTSPGDERDEFQAAFVKGTKLLHKGKPADAVPLLERAYILRPQHLDTGINLAGAYILNKKFRKAVRVLQPLSEQYPESPMLWTNLGAALLGNPVLAGDEQQMNAIEAFERALALDPVAPSVAYNIGLIYRDRGETSKAIEWFEKALQHNPRDKHARNIISNLEASLSSDRQDGEEVPDA